MIRLTATRFPALVVLLVGALSAFGCSREQTDKIRIGEYGSLTGATATFGMSTKNGADLAFEEVNAAGGVLGKQVEVVVEDDRGQAPEAATAVSRLINQHRAVAVLGTVSSKLSLTVAPICQHSGIPMVSPASTNPAVTEVGDYIFRVCFIDPFQGTAMARFASENLKVKRVAILRDINNDYSIGLAKFFTQEFKRLGGAITTDSSYSQGDTDFKAQLTTIRAGNPEAVFVPGYYTEVGLIANQAREVGLAVPLLGGDGWDSPELLKIGGKAMENTYFSNHYSVEDTSERVQAFVRKYREKYGDSPDAFAALAYDAAHVLCDAIARAGSTEPQAIRDALAKTSGYQGVTGSISLDAQRNARKPAVVLQVKDGKLRFAGTVEP